jgi:cell division protein FtsB
MNRSVAKAAYAVLLVLVFTYAFFTLRGRNGVAALMQRRQEIQDLEKRNLDLAREIEHKKERIDRLRGSQTEQELEIRHRLKLVRPGEKVFITPDTEKKTAAPPTSGTQ